MNRFKNTLSYHYLFSLSIHTILNIGEKIKMKDIYGNDHDLTSHHVRVMLAVGWACFLGSWLINIAYYKFHPSGVEVFSLSALSDKKKLYILGKDRLASPKRNNRRTSGVEGRIFKI